MYDIGIIGGGTAGMTAAVYGQRAGKKTLIIREEHSVGKSRPPPMWKTIPASQV